MQVYIIWGTVRMPLVHTAFFVNFPTGHPKKRCGEELSRIPLPQASSPHIMPLRREYVLNRYVNLPMCMISLH